MIYIFQSFKKKRNGSNYEIEMLKWAIISSRNNEENAYALLI